MNRVKIYTGSAFVGVFVFFALGQAGLGKDVIYQWLIGLDFVSDYAAHVISKTITGTSAMLAAYFFASGWVDYSCGEWVSTNRLKETIKNLENGTR